jgi:hypothetical protein
MTPVALVLGGIVGGGVLLVFVWALWIGRARLEIHSDHAFFDYRPRGATGRYFKVEFDSLTSVALMGVGIVFRLKKGPAIEFRGSRLHVEDAYEALVSNLEAGYPGCVILRRRSG